MSRVKIGKVAFNPKGSWDSTTTYEKLDIVTSGDKTFIARQDVPIGTTTSSTTYYQEITSESAIENIEVDSINWEFGNISTSAPWNTNATNRIRTSANEIPIGNKVTITFDATKVKCSFRLYDKHGKFLKSGSASTYFDHYDYNTNWDTSGIITIFSDNTVGYFRLCAAFSNDATINNIYDVTKYISISRTGKLDEQYIETSSIPLNTINSPSRSHTQYPTLCAVKELHQSGQTDVTIGWLYRDNISPFNFYYASGSPENAIKIFTWNSSIANNREPMEYAFTITEEGDIIAVFRGELNGNNGEAGPIRDNPIVYPHENYENPIVVDLSAATQPTAWLMNTGVFCEHGAMYFCEYTRPRHTEGNLWKVSSPYTSTSNWTIKKTYTTSEIEHWHHITRDPYTQIMYASTGDTDTESKILYSSDNGDTWTVLREGDQKICRQLNFIFLKDKIYWATDAVSSSADRVFCRSTRDSNGLLKISDNDVEILHQFNYPGFATYHICYIRKPEGILLLERSDVHHNQYLGTYYFWNIQTDKMKYIGSFEPNGDVYPGFRCEAVTHYPALLDDNTILAGFSLFPNQIIFRGNPSVEAYLDSNGSISSDSYNNYTYNNLLLKVINF